MSPERFGDLLAAHGADFGRWPEAERDAARALAAAMPEARARLAEEARLDGWLDAHAVAPPDAALAQRIASLAPQRGARGRWRHWLWPGAGLAGVGLAGTLAGALVMAFALRTVAPRPLPDWIERGTAFSEPSADWSEE